MSLSITHQTPSTTHLHPGSHLKGSVHVTSQSDTAISKVTITFSGRCKVKIREHLHYTTRTFRSRGYYFYLTKEVFDGGGFTHKAGEYKWDFEFVVPKAARRQDEVDVPRVGGFKGRRVLDSNGIMKVVELEDDGGRGRYDEFPFRRPWRGSWDLRRHELPDSFTCSGSEGSVDWEGRVEYTLIARMERPQSGSKLFAALGRAADLEAVVDVPIRSGFDEMSMPMLKERQRLDFERYVGGDSKSKVGFSKVLTRVIKGKTSTDQDSANQDSGQPILFTVEVAKAVQQESTIPFMIKIRIPTSSTTTAIPAPLITNLKVMLCGQTSVRNDSSAATEHDAVNLLTYGLRYEPLQRCVRIHMTQTPEDGLEGDVNRTGMFVGQADLTYLTHMYKHSKMIPSFSTYNIAGEWRIYFELTIYIVGKKYTISPSRPFPQIVVLPASSDVGRKSVEDEKQGDVGGLDEKKVLSKEDDAVVERDDAKDIERAEEIEEQLPAYEP